MAERDKAPLAERWAHLRFSVVGPLLAYPPPMGELRQGLQKLAERHLDTGEITADGRICAVVAGYGDNSLNGNAASTTHLGRYELEILLGNRRPQFGSLTYNDGLPLPAPPSPGRIADSSSVPPAARASSRGDRTRRSRISGASEGSAGRSSSRGEQSTSTATTPWLATAAPRPPRPTTSCTRPLFTRRYSTRVSNQAQCYSTRATP